MLYVKSHNLDAAYHFAVEEYLLHHFELDQPIVMLWQTQPTVMLGQGQIADAEVKLDLAAADTVNIVRRPSGGGAIYTDEGTLLLSLVLPEKHCKSGTVVQFPQKAAQAEFVELLTSALVKLDIPAEPQGRNDIVLEDRKISGMAQHVYRGRSCTHGSLLFDANLENLAALLRVDEDKFRSKAVKSIRGRVTNIKEYAQENELPLARKSTAEFVQLLTETTIETNDAQPLILSADDESAILNIYQEKYGNPDWARRKTPLFSQHTRKRFEAGLLDVYLDVAKGSVVACAIHGDFLGSAPISHLEQALIGLPYGREEFKQALDAFTGKEAGDQTLSLYLGDISAEEFLSCVFD